MDGWFGRWASRRAQASGRPTGRVRAQVSALIKVRHEEAGAILGIEGEKLGTAGCWASAPTCLYPVDGIAAVCGCREIRARREAAYG